MFLTQSQVRALLALAEDHVQHNPNAAGVRHVEAAIPKLGRELHRLIIRDAQRRTRRERATTA